MGIGQPGMHRPHRHLHRERGKERQPHQRLNPTHDGEPQEGQRVAVKRKRHQRRNVGGARLRIHRNHRHQHQHRAKKCVEEKLERGIDPVLAAPDADNQEHRDQTGLEEQVEQHQIKGDKHPQHQGFQQQKRDHVFLDPGLNIPTGGDGQRHQKRGQHDEQHRNAINPQLVFQPQYPVAFFDKLKPGVGGIKPGEQEQRGNESNGGRAQSGPFRRLPRRCVVATQEQGQDHRSHHRQKGDER